MIEIIAVKDKRSGGYTGHLRVFPNAIAQGETEEELKRSLAETMYDIVMNGEVKVFNEIKYEKP